MLMLMVYLAEYVLVHFDLVCLNPVFVTGPVMSSAGSAGPDVSNPKSIAIKIV